MGGEGWDVLRVGNGREEAQKAQKGVLCAFCAFLRPIFGPAVLDQWSGECNDARAGALGAANFGGAHPPSPRLRRGNRSDAPYRGRPGSWCGWPFDHGSSGDLQGPSSTFQHLPALSSYFQVFADSPGSVTNNREGFRFYGGRGIADCGLRIGDFWGCGRTPVPHLSAMVRRYSGKRRG